MNNKYTLESERRQQEYIAAGTQRGTESKLDAHGKAIEAVHLRLRKLEHVLALVVEKAGMGRRVLNDDGEEGITFTGHESSLERSRERGRQLRLDLNGQRDWKDEIRSN